MSQGAGSLCGNTINLQVRGINGEAMCQQSWFKTTGLGACLLTGVTLPEIPADGETKHGRLCSQPG